MTNFVVILQFLLPISAICISIYMIVYKLKNIRIKKKEEHNLVKELSYRKNSLEKKFENTIRELKTKKMDASERSLLLIELGIIQKEIEKIVKNNKRKYSKISGVLHDGSEESKLNYIHKILDKTEVAHQHQNVPVSII